MFFEFFVDHQIECEAHSTHRCHRCIWDHGDWMHPNWGVVDDSAATNDKRVLKAINQDGVWVPKEYGVLTPPSTAPDGHKDEAAKTYLHDFRSRCEESEATINRDANGAINIRNHFLWKVAQYHLSNDTEKRRFESNWHNPNHRHPAFWIKLSNY